jgi:hypothetical protein
VSKGADPEKPSAEPIELSDPRSLSSREQALVDYLLAHPLGKPALRAQADMSMVESVCSCGCPSVWLSVDPSAPSAEYSADETPDGRTDHVALTAFQRKSRGTTEATLHVVNGRLFELEIWAGEGVRPRVDLSKLEYS